MYQRTNSPKIIITHFLFAVLTTPFAAIINANGYIGSIYLNPSCNLLNDAIIKNIQTGTNRNLTFLLIPVLMKEKIPNKNIRRSEIGVFYGRGHNKI